MSEALEQARRRVLAGFRAADAMVLAHFAIALVDRDLYDVEALAELIRWHPADGYLFSLPLAEARPFWIGYQPITFGAARLNLHEPGDGFAPIVWDFAAPRDAAASAFDMAVQGLAAPRDAHRWCRRAVYGGEIEHRPEYLPDQLQRA